MIPLKLIFATIRDIFVIYVDSDEYYKRGVNCSVVA